MAESLTSHSWWDYISPDLQELIKQSIFLVDIIDSQDFKLSEKYSKFHDYSFLVFPAAKAYEGFLKKLLFDMGFISDKAFYGKRFRIGKALNPFLEEKLRKQSVYDKLADFCQGTELPDAMWDTWVKGRNQLFHWFPNERNSIEFTEAKEIIEQIFKTMDKAFEECRINTGASV